MSPEELVKNEEIINVSKLNLVKGNLTENALISVYLKIIKKYEIQIAELQFTIKILSKIIDK